MKVEMFYGNDNWCRVHRAGCRDTKLEERKDGIGSGLLRMEATTKLEVVAEAASDFIEPSGEETLADVVSWVSFAPCTAGLEEVPA